MLDFCKGWFWKKDQYQSFVRERQLQTKVSHIIFCFPNCLSERASWQSVRIMLLKLPLSLPVFTDTLFTCLHVKMNVVVKNCISKQHIRLNTATEFFWHFQCMRLSNFVVASMPDSDGSVGLERFVHFERIFNVTREQRVFSGSDSFSHACGPSHRFCTGISSPVTSLLVFRVVRSSHD